MDDDDTPVIRPVLPSRASGPPAPMWQEAGAVANERQSQDLQRFPLSPKPERTKPVTQPKKDPRRSAAAREAWKKRRKQMKVESYEPGPVLMALTLASKLTQEELDGFTRAVTMLHSLSAASRKLVLDALIKVFP